MTEISAMYEALDNMDDYALMANVKPIGPHKVLTDAIAELEQLRQRVQELTAERDKATQYWQIAEGRCDALKQQRDDLLAALEQFATWGRMQHKAQSKGCQRRNQ